MPTRKISLPSDHSSRPEWRVAAWDELISLIQTLSPEEAKRTLETVLSDKEISQIISRVAAIQLLKMNTPYRKINYELDLTQQTISAIKKSIAKGKYSNKPSKKKRNKTYRTFTVKEGRPHRTKYGIVRY